MARGVMRRPVGVALVSSALLLAAAAPLLWTTLTGPSAEAVPQSKPSYETNSYVEAHYPRELIEAVTVTVDGGADKAALAHYRARIEGVAGIVHGAPFVTASDQIAYANFG